MLRYPQAFATSKSPHHQIRCYLTETKALKQSRKLELS